MRTEGYAQRIFSKNELNIVLNPRHSKFSLEAYGVLCHEIAHILLGHLGEIKIPAKKGNGTDKVIAKNRANIKKHIKEIEAELVAWMVFNALGIEKKSESYLATWLSNKDDFQDISMSNVLRVAGKIQDMGKRKKVF